MKMLLGSLMSKSATQLGAAAIKSALGKSGVNQIDEVIMGCVLQAGLGQAPARQAALFAGLDHSTPCTTVNKVCASGMKAIMLSATTLSQGLQTMMVAGGMESISNSPFYLRREALSYGGVRLQDACHFDALTDVYSNWHMGKCAEHTAKTMNITREEQDDYSKLSLKRLQDARLQGVYDQEISELQLGDDEKSSSEVKSDEKIEIMNPFSFKPEEPTPWGQTITRASASKLADGAAACVLTNTTGLAKYGLKPQAKIIGFMDSAQNPVEWPTSPAVGIKKLLEKLSLHINDVALWEINEAFALVVLANARLLDLNLNKVNVNGGAIGMGHPFGMSGARITNHLVHQLKEGEIGIASLCNGGGGASTIAIQRV